MANLLRFIRQQLAFLYFLSTLFETSSALFCDLTILPVILIFYGYATLVMMPSFLFQSLADNLRLIALHVAFGILISTSFHFLRICVPDSSLLFEEICVRLWAVVLCVFIYNAHTILEFMPHVQFTSVADLLRSIPRHESFGNLMEELTCLVEWRFPKSSPLVEIKARTLTLVASRSIYRCTRDVISGSLACVALISFIISRDETPMYVFIIWAICLVSYLKNNRALIPGD